MLAILVCTLMLFLMDVSFVLLTHLTLMVWGHVLPAIRVVRLVTLRMEIVLHVLVALVLTTEHVLLVMLHHLPIKLTLFALFAVQLVRLVNLMPITVPVVRLDMGCRTTLAINAEVELHQMEINLVKLVQLNIVKYVSQ